jgi:hypothetical protein
MDPLHLEALDNHNNQPATGATKTGGGWQEGVDEATTRPRRWATTNDKGVRRMVMAVTKRARMARAMVTAMRVPVNKEGKDSTGHGVDKGGVQQRGQGRRRQEQWRRGWRMSNGNKGNGDRRRTTINQGQDQQRRVVAGKRAPVRQPHDHDCGRGRTTRACGG